MMKAIVIRKHIKTTKDFSVEEIPDDACPDDGVLVKVKAIGLNFWEFLMATGQYQVRPPLPFIVGAEYSGVIIEVGKQVQQQIPGKWNVGDRVYGLTTHNDREHGSYAERVAVRVLDKATAGEYRLFKIPPGLSFAEGTAIIQGYETAWTGLVIRAKITSQDTVLIHAGAGCVGLAAVHVAKYFGAIVIATCGSPDKVAVVKSQGADYVIDYNADKNWPQSVKKITEDLVASGRRERPGVSVCYDPVGLVRETFKCAGFDCRIVVIGFAGRTPQTPEQIPTNLLLVKHLNVMAGMRRADPKTIPAMVEGIAKMFETPTPFRPVIFPKKFKGIESVPGALQEILDRKTYAKVVVELDDDASSKL